MRAASGDLVNLSNWCRLDCASCDLAFCPLIVDCPAAPLPPEGSEFSWDGRYFSSGTCADQECARAQCAAPGSHWVVTLCAYRNMNPGGADACAIDAMRQCVDVAFDYPTTELISATLYPTR